MPFPGLFQAIVQPCSENDKSHQTTAIKNEDRGGKGGGDEDNYATEEPHILMCNSAFSALVAN
eukprot:6720620-Pyramimonas_sp.AAC.1